MRRALALLTTTLLFGCPDSALDDAGLSTPDTGVRVDSGEAPEDAGEPADAAAGDAAPGDALVPADADVEDAGAGDAEISDSEVEDAQVEDADAPDAQAPDAEPADVGPEDTGVMVDSGVPVDSGVSPDSGVPPDSGVHPDAGPPPDAGFTQETIIDENGNPVSITNGPPGLPVNVGCSDGQREGLVDDSVYPNMAGCLGTWTGAVSLRGTQTSTACGDDLGTCPEAVDLCAPGWHVCGTSGLVAEVSQLSATECDNAGGGRYVTAISHCLTQSGCQYDTSSTAVYNCWASGWCSEPVCCGQTCTGLGACPSGVWPNDTNIPVGTDQGCAAITSRRAGGVLCCR